MGGPQPPKPPSDLNAVAGRPNCSVKPKQGAESPAQTHSFLLQPSTDVTPCRAVAQHQQSSDVTEKEVMLRVHKKWNVLLWSLFDVQNCVTDETELLAFNGGYRGGAPCCYQYVLGLHRSSLSISARQQLGVGAGVEFFLYLFLYLPYKQSIAGRAVHEEM